MLYISVGYVKGGGEWVGAKFFLFFFWFYVKSLIEK